MAGDMDGKGMAQDQIVYVEDGFKLSGDPSKLGSEGGQVSPLYLSCDDVETREHMLFGCSWAKQIW